MKTYKVSQYKSGESLYVDVNFPTPKELQAGSELGDVRVVISNFSSGKNQSYAVAKFELETNPAMIKIGFKFKTETDNVYSAGGKGSREIIKSVAAAFLVGNH